MRLNIACSIVVLAIGLVGCEADKTEEAPKPKGAESEARSDSPSDSRSDSPGKSSGCMETNGTSCRNVKINGKIGCQKSTFVESICSLEECIATWTQPFAGFSQTQYFYKNYTEYSISEIQKTCEELDGRFSRTCEPM